MDWFAIVSLGMYPTPTPTNSARAAYAVSYGLLSDLGEIIGGFIRLRLDMEF